MSRWDTPAIVTAVAVFVALLLLLEGLYLLWRSVFGAQARQVNQRLKALGQERERARAAASRVSAAAGPLGAWLQQLPARSALERLLLQADLRWPAGQWLALTVLAALVTILLLKLLGSSWAGSLAAGAALGLLPWGHVLLRRQRRLRQLQAQLPDALDMLTRAIRAGHALSSALQMAGQEMSEPIAGQLRLVHEELNFGLTLQQALTHLTERVPLSDLRYFVVAVQIQRESGGNLAEVLGKLAQLIRARLRLLDRVRVLSSEGRLSAWILALLPFILGGLLTAFNPRFMQPLWTDPIGITLLKWMFGLMLLGVLLIARIVRIRV